MATQRVTLVKLGGVAGTDAVALFRRWRASAQHMADGGVEWPSELLLEMERFRRWIEAHAYEPPVLFHLAYSDLWSVGDSLLDSLRDAWEERAIVVVPGCTMLCYALPDGGRLEEKAAALLSLRDERMSEERWFIINLLEAVRAWDQLVRESAILVFREAYGGSPTDDEVAAKCREPVAWGVGIREGD